MACTASKTPLLRTIASRGFATPKPAISKSSELQVTTLPNKLVVASVDGNSALSHASITFRVGSRNETYDDQGVTHVLRASAHVTNKNSTAFGVTRNVHASGGSLIATSGRETISYNIAMKRDQLSSGLKYLQDVATQQDFKEWEINTVLALDDFEPEKAHSIANNVQLELAQVSVDVRAVDLLHQAAFHRELGNSVYCAKRNVGKISADCLQHFVNNNYTSNRGAVVGVGIDHQLLIGYAKNLFLETGAATTAASKYIGGQLRVDKRGRLASVALATPGAALSNQKEALAFLVLQHVAGTGCNIKHSGNNGALGKTVGSVLSNPHTLNALSASYTDNGLFGFVLTADAQEIGKAIDAAVKALKTGSVSQADVGRAKAILKAATAERLRSTEGLVAHLATQAVIDGQVQSTSDVIAAIDAVTVADVNAAAKKVATGKWSLGAVGNLKNVPHICELN